MITGREINSFSGLTAVGKKSGGGGTDAGPLPRYGEIGGMRWALRRISAAQVCFGQYPVSSLNAVECCVAETALGVGSVTLHSCCRTKKLDVPMHVILKDLQLDQWYDY